MSEFCSACSVVFGECQTCGTFWFRQGAKRYGVRPSLEIDAWQAVNGPTVPSGPGWNYPMFLGDYPNVVGPLPDQTEEG